MQTYGKEYLKFVAEKAGYNVDFERQEDHGLQMTVSPLDQPETWRRAYADLEHESTKDLAQAIAHTIGELAWAKAAK